eukprot:jgi/Galph1/685/GphlegSOOS_G5435.1
MDKKRKRTEENHSVKPDTSSTKYHITGIPVRDKVRSIFAQVLKVVEGGSQTASRNIVEDIEEELFLSCDKETGQEYQERFRTLYRNLKDAKNAALREAVLTRKIPPKDFVVMSPHELANPELKKEREERRKESIRESKKGVDVQTFSEEFKCRKCGLRKCSFFQMQTRSADEPMTTFVTCHNCGNRWKQ